MSNRLLVSTPRCVYLLDLSRERLIPLHASSPEYYGISWNELGLALSHSEDDNSRPWEPRDFDSNDRFGVIGLHVRDGTRRDSLREILHGHQVEQIGSDLVIANTGRNAISVWNNDSSDISACRDRFFEPDSLRHRFLTTSQWDGLKPGTVSLHLNSVHVQDDVLYAVAHNGAYLSAIWQFTWPGLELAAVFGTRARWAHNVWHTGSFAGLVTCNSMRGTIYSVDHDEDIWSAGDAELLTRGLAVSRESLCVGISEFTARSERASSDGGVALVDRATLRTRESLWFSGIGNVHEVRLLDDTDECHAAGPATAPVLELIDAWQEQGRSREIAPRVKRAFIASASVSGSHERVAPAILEFNGGAQMSIEVIGPGNARVVTRRVGDSNLMLSRAQLDESMGGVLLSARAWCMVERGAQDAYARLRLCFLDAKGGYLSEYEARSEPAGLGEAPRHWLELVAVAPPDKRIKSAELMWLQSGDGEIYLRACSFSTMPLPGSPRKAKALPTSF